MVAYVALFKVSADVTDSTSCQSADVMSRNVENSDGTVVNRTDGCLKQEIMIFSVDQETS